ncbi:MAG: hypothetical protein Q7S50_03045 [bacterium]|nr:hypothetical protein [bacterium]
MKNQASENQMPLFSTPSERGSREWSTFNVVRYDQAGAYRVLTPRKHETPRYTNILHINRLPAQTGYPRHITPTFVRQ